MNENQYYEEISIEDVNVPNLPKGKGLGDLLGERKQHREKLFRFACYLTIASFYLLAGIVIVQMIHRSLGEYSFEVMDSVALNILAVSVFGQIVGVIYIIADSLWDGKEFDMFGNDKR